MADSHTPDRPLSDPPIPREPRAGLSRRFLLQATAAGIAGAAIGSTLQAGQAKPTPAATPAATGTPAAARNSAVDVVVIGAGISGLIAARELERRGLSTTTLEAAQRIGGRCLRRKTIQNWWIDLGGQWIGKTHHLFSDLAQELKLSTFDSHFEGDSVLMLKGQRLVRPMEEDWESSYLNLDPRKLPISEHDQKEALRVHQQFLKLANTVNPVEPWATPGAQELDSETIESWMRRQTDSDFAQYIYRDYTRIGGSGGYEPNEASILHLALTYKAAPQGESPEYQLLVGAAGQMPALLQQQIRGQIQTAAAARLVSREGDGYRVSAANGSEHRCRSVVVALPPALRSRIVFEPGLPHRVNGFCQRAPMGSMIKVMAIYDSAWWRDQGLSGFAQGQLSALALTADSSPPSGRPGILAGFVAADKALQIGQLSAAERRGIILDDLVTYFGSRAGKPRDYAEFNWGNEAWVTGGFTSFMTPGAWTSFGPAWREPVGRIVWAGTESSTRWAGYYEGAIQAGLDAAARVRSLLA